MKKEEKLKFTAKRSKVEELVYLSVDSLLKDNRIFAKRQSSISLPAIRHKTTPQV